MSMSAGHSSAETSQGSDSRHPFTTASNSQDPEATKVFNGIGDPTELFNKTTDDQTRDGEDDQRRLQRKIADHQELLVATEHEIADTLENLRDFKRQLDDGKIDSDQFESRTDKFTEQLEMLEHRRKDIRRVIDESIPDVVNKPVTHDPNKAPKVMAEARLTMTKRDLEGHVQEAVAKAIAMQNRRTIGEVRIDLGEAYVEQSKITDRLTELRSQSSRGNLTQRDEDEIAQCEQQLQVNMDRITELELEMPNTRPNDPLKDAKSSIMKLHNIPPSAQTSRRTSPNRKPTQSASGTAKPILKTADSMSTPVDPEETARRLQSAADMQQEEEASDNNSLHGPANTKQQVATVLDKVRDEAPDTHRPSRGTGDDQFNRSSTFGRNRPLAPLDTNTRPQAVETKEKKPSISSSTSEMARVRHALPGYAKSVAPITFSGKSGQDVTRFIKQMDRYLRRAEIDNEEEMTEHLHKYLSDEIRTSLMNALTDITEYDYAAQIKFLRCWWGRTRDPRPLMDEYEKIRYTLAEDLDSYASRIERGRRAGWPHESMIRHSGFHSDYEKAIMGGFLRGLPANLRHMIDRSGKLDDIELHQSEFRELVEFTRIQMRNMAKRERLHCNDCGRGCGHETQDCPRKQRVNAVSEGADDTAPLTDVDQGIWNDHDITQAEQACAMIRPNAPYPQQQHQQQNQPFRQQRPLTQQKPQFLREQQARNNFQPGTNNRGNNPRPGNNAGQKRFDGCYNCGQIGHLIAQCPHPLKARMPDKSNDLTEVLKALDVIRKAIFLQFRSASGSRATQLQQEAKTIDYMINSIQDNLEAPEEDDTVDLTENSDPLNP